MAKKSTNFNQWRRIGHSAADVAELMHMFGVTPDELRATLKSNAGSRREHFTCPRCQTWVETEINNYDNSAVCPHCENQIIVAKGS
jgi:hypothetical protein